MTSLEAELLLSTQQATERKVEQLAGDLHAVRVLCANIEAKMDNLGKIEEAQARLDARLTGVETWRAAFEGEKRERDKRADEAASMWRRVAVALLVALVVSVAGAAFGVWTQSQSSLATQQQLLEQLRAQDARLQSLQAAQQAPRGASPAASPPAP